MIDEQNIYYRSFLSFIRDHIASAIKLVGVIIKETVSLGTMMQINKINEIIIFHSVD
mgnify:CR=1 FL=1